jgi:hypothetical protein
MIASQKMEIMKLIPWDTHYIGMITIMRHYKLGQSDKERSNIDMTNMDMPLSVSEKKEW